VKAQVQQDFAKVEVYFQTLEVEVIVRSPKFAICGVRYTRNMIVMGQPFTPDRSSVGGALKVRLNY
jgi:hypothetical protein